MIHATIQYTQTDKSRNCFDLSKDLWLYFCISLEAAAICDEGLATKSQSYKGEGLGSDPEMGWVGWEGYEKVAWDLNLVLFSRNSRYLYALQTIYVRQRTDIIKEKNNDVDCYLKNCSNIKKSFRTLEATRSVKTQPRD